MPKDKKVEIIKDEKITDGQREDFYNFVIEHKITSMPSFNEGETPDLIFVIAYAVNLCPDEIVEYNGDDKHSTAIPVATVDRVAKQKFGITYDFSEYDTVIPLRAEGTKGVPMCELVHYEQEKTDLGTLISAGVAEYTYGNLFLCKDPQTERPDEYKSAKEEIISAKGDTSVVDNIVYFKYLADDDGKPIKFISVEKASRGPDGFLKFVK